MLYGATKQNCTIANVTSKYNDLRYFRNTEGMKSKSLDKIMGKKYCGRQLINKQRYIDLIDSKDNKTCPTNEKVNISIDGNITEVSVYYTLCHFVRAKCVKGKVCPINDL